MAYKITPEEKKSIVVIETFKRNIRNKECQFNAVTRWFSGYVIVNEKPAEQPDPNADEKRLYADALDIIDQDFSNGDVELQDFSENLTPKEKERILNTSYHDLEDKGWELDDSEIWILGDLLIEEVKSEKKQTISSDNPWAHFLK